MSHLSSRRHFVQQASAGIGSLSLTGWLSAQNISPAGLLHIVCVGAHPDDPESGCGGVLARFAAAGHRVTIIYLTRGEAGIPGKSLNESAQIRTREAQEACTILKTNALFAGQIDGDTILNNEWVGRMKQLILQETPDIVFTHWPIDTHKDHEIASQLTIQTWIQTTKKFDLYFFEVCTGAQTMVFKPTDYVDITEVQEQKRKAVYCHVSQDPPSIYQCGHEAMEGFRGREIGVKAAEAFVRMTAMKQGNYFELNKH